MFSYLNNSDVFHRCPLCSALSIAPDIFMHRESDDIVVARRHIKPNIYALEVISV